MAVNTTGQGNISMLSIAQEKQNSSSTTAFSNISLEGLSKDGVTDYGFYNGDITTNEDPSVSSGGPDQAAPHNISEFSGYTQINTHDVSVTFGSPQGKIGFRTGTITSGADVPFGNINLNSFSATDNNNYVRMTWLNTDEDGNSNSGPNTSWTKVELPDGTEFNRTDLTENGLTQGLFPASNSQYSSWGSGTWTFTYS